MKQMISNKQKIRLGIVSILLLAVLVASAFMIFRGLSLQQKEKDDFKSLAGMVTVTPTELPQTDTLPNESSAEKSQQSGRNLSELFAMNGDCIGWICIPGTAVDYPVMYTPDNPQKYLRKNFYGEYSTSGVPFLDGRCDTESNIIIYGHNMKNGTMFGSLRYYTDSEFYTEHSVIELQTADGVYSYKIFAVLKTDNTDEWYNFITADGKDCFDERIKEIKSRSLFQTDITPEYGQRLLTLSTCYGSSKCGRLLVLAV